MGHCKHHWQERTEVLHEVFVSGERRKHAFFVCTRCLKIDEVVAPPVSLERPGVPSAWAGKGKDERAA